MSNFRGAYHLPFLFSLLINPGVDKGPQPLMFNPALTTQGELPRRGKRRPPGGCASERMKTFRFSYFSDFAARKRVCGLGKICYLKKVHMDFFDTLLFYLRIALGLPRISAYITARLQASRSAAERKGREAGSAGERGRAPAASTPE